MKLRSLIALAGMIGLLCLPLPLGESAGGEGRALSGPRLSEVVHCVSNAGPPPQPSPWKGEGAEPIEFVQNLATTFATIDIRIDPLGKPLAAYQFELTSEDATFTVVGVESGEHAAFNHGRPPYFDPVAKQGETDRLILAEYAMPSIEADQLPTASIRVATVHVMFTGPVNEEKQPTIQLALMTAGNPDAERIDARISHTFRTPERPE